MIEPPIREAIDSAVKRLKDVGALYQVNFWLKCRFINLQLWGVFHGFLISLYGLNSLIDSILLD